MFDEFTDNVNMHGAALPSMLRAALLVGLFVTATAGLAAFVPEAGPPDPSPGGAPSSETATGAASVRGPASEPALVAPDFGFQDGIGAATSEYASLTVTGGDTGGEPPLLPRVAVVAPTPTSGNCLRVEGMVIQAIANLTWTPNSAFSENLTVHVWDVGSQNFIANRSGPGPFWVGILPHSTVFDVILLPDSMQFMAAQEVDVEIYLRWVGDIEPTVTVIQCEDPA